MALPTRGSDGAQDGEVERVQAGVDLADPPLLGGGVAVLDERDHATVGVAEDPAVAGGVGHGGRDDGDRGRRGRVGLEQAAEGLGGEQRDVAVGDEHRAGEVGGQRVEAALDGPAGAGHLVLVGDDDVGVELGHVLGDPVALGAHDDDEVVRMGPPGRRHGVLEEGTAADRVQDLGEPGPHPRALTGGEDHDGGRTKGAHRGGTPRAGGRTAHGRRPA